MQRSWRSTCTSGKKKVLSGIAEIGKQQAKNKNLQESHKILSGIAAIRQTRGEKQESSGFS
jgi:hypothetical protein